MNQEYRQKPWLPSSWDKQADVIVIGYGGAGAVAAITAFDTGADVLLLEKSPSLASLGITDGPFPTMQISGGGGNTHISFGDAVSPSNAEDAANYLYEACQGQTPRDVCDAWAEEVCKNEAWFNEMGIEGSINKVRRSEYPSLPGWSAMTIFQHKGWGATFFAKLDRHVQDRGIRIFFDTPGKELIQDYETGEIVGVRAEYQGKDISIKARRGVVLCTGGFEFNEEMKNRFLKCWPMKFYGWKYNTGDGVRMAQKVGADLWHMDVMCGGNCTWVDDPKYDFGIHVMAKTSHNFWVNKFGKRFCNEPEVWNPHGGWVVHLERNLEYHGFSRVPSYLIFDETARKAGPISTSRPKGEKEMLVWLTILPPELGGFEGWSQDNLKEIERGWIKKGETIEALAEAIGGEMDPILLKATLESYNDYCAAGNDPEFGRDANKLLPLENPPFYGIPLYPGLVSTCGGPMRSARAEILNVDRAPIPRLYSAGSCGSIYGNTYSVTGGNLGELCAFGRIAGRNVAALGPWD